MTNNTTLIEAAALALVIYETGRRWTLLEARCLINWDKLCDKAIAAQAAADEFRGVDEEKLAALAEKVQHLAFTAKSGEKRTSIADAMRPYLAQPMPERVEVPIDEAAEIIAKGYLHEQKNFLLLARLQEKATPLGEGWLQRAIKSAGYTISRAKE